MNIPEIKMYTYLDSMKYVRGKVSDTKKMPQCPFTFVGFLYIRRYGNPEISQTTFPITINAGPHYYLRNEKWPFEK